MSTLSRRHMLGTAAALLAAGLTACGGDSGSNDDASQPRTTLLVYLLGSNLESEDSAGTLNLMEMLSAQGSPHTRIVITTGGADKVDPKGLVSSWKTVKRFELADGRLKELADLGAHNMNEGGTLQDFVTWAIRTYPAERTLLMMWDHGSGYEGFGGDENFPDGPRSMSIPALAAALQGAQAATGVKLDYLGFDACLMATVEVAKILQPCARYLGASQELEPGSGWDWKAVIETASRQPAPSLPEFGQVVGHRFPRQAAARPAARQHRTHAAGRLHLQHHRYGAHSRPAGAARPMGPPCTLTTTVELHWPRPMSPRWPWSATPRSGHPSSSRTAHRPRPRPSLPPLPPQARQPSNAGSKSP